MQNFGVTKKEHYGMLWYFLEWSIVEMSNFSLKDKTKISDKFKLSSFFLHLVG